MVSRNWEDWAFGLSLAFATVLGLALNEARAPSFATIAAATAAERSAPDYVITVTAKRLPAACKGVSDFAAPAYCATLRDDQTVRLRANR